MAVGHDCLMRALRRRAQQRVRRRLLSRPLGTIIALVERETTEVQALSVDEETFFILNEEGVAATGMGPCWATEYVAVPSFTTVSVDGEESRVAFSK